MVHLGVKGLLQTAQQCELIKEMMRSAVQGFPGRLKAVISKKGG